MYLTYFVFALQELLFTSIQEGIYEFPEREWGVISDDAKDLIKRLLVKEARQRISADSVLNHPWIQPGPATRGLYTPHIIRRYDWSPMSSFVFFMLQFLCYKLLINFFLFIYRNNSARDLSAFAESAMAVNRVVLQHFSMNMDLVPREEYHPNSKTSCSAAVADSMDSGHLFGLSPPSESRLLQRRLQANSVPLIPSPSC